MDQGPKRKTNFFAGGLRRMACGILFPQPGPRQCKRRVLTTGPLGNSQD